MARVMSTPLKAQIDEELGPGGAAAMIVCMNSANFVSATTHANFDGPTRSILAKVFKGVGAANAFENLLKGVTNVNNGITDNSTTLSNYDLLQMFEHKFGGRGNAEELVLCINDGNVT